MKAVKGSQCFINGKRMTMHTTLQHTTKQDWKRVLMALVLVAVVFVGRSATTAQAATPGLRLQGVTLASGRQLKLENFVIAAGAWSAQIGDMLGWALPITPLPREEYVRPAVQVRAVQHPHPNRPDVFRPDLLHRVERLL